MFLYTQQAEMTKKKIKKLTHLAHEWGKQSKLFSSDNRYLHEYFMHRGHLYLASSLLQVSHLKEVKNTSQ